LAERRTKWLIGIGGITVTVLAALSLAGYVLASRLEPYIRTQAIAYLQSRFDADVELGALRVRMPRLSPVQVLFRGGRGVFVGVEGDSVLLRHKTRRDLPPMFSMQKFSVEVELATLFDDTTIVRLATMDGVKINVPPKAERPQLDSGADENNVADEADRGDRGSAPSVLFEEVIITNAVLTILPKDRTKSPLRYDIHRLTLRSAGENLAMKYDAALTNAKPSGEIQSTGTFGPWVAREPGDSPIDGDYRFDNADLGVFSGIAGILHSSGRFKGSLSAVSVRGEATVPDFRLKRAGNPVPLRTTFEVLVDGTNGDTILQPVNGTLGSTDFTTSGGILKQEGDSRRTIRLDVSMPRGNLRDILTLAMRSPPFMQGQIFLKTTIEIPPLTGKVREKLLLDGQFEISRGRFLRSTIQKQIDSLSRRGQGQPQNEEIGAVVSVMGGRFKLENEVITFQSLSFAVPGAGVDLTGSYDLDQDALDFHGTLRLRATVSQTMTGWKRWALKPVDPFFSKEGSGTLLNIQVVGTSKEPNFGRDRGDKDPGK
jgi:AsmA-like C-terminal region